MIMPPDSATAKRRKYTTILEDASESVGLDWNHKVNLYTKRNKAIENQDSVIDDKSRKFLFVKIFTCLISNVNVILGDDDVNDTQNRTSKANKLKGALKFE